MDIVSVLGEDGELLHRVLTAQDISERKQAEENLRKNEERYRHLFENNPHPMWTYDRETLAFLDVNGAAIQKYGYSRSEFLQMTIADIRPAEDVERLKAYLSQSRPTLQRSSGWRHRLKDGTVIDVEITSHIVEIDDHEAALVVAQDVTERKRAEEKLRESEAKYRTLVEHLPVITYISEPDAYVGVSFISPQIVSYGFDVDTWLADPELWFRCIYPDDQERVNSALEQFQAGAETFKAEYRLLLPNGELRWFHDESIRVKDQSGRTILKQGFMLDITEAKQAEAVLHESEERYRLVSEITSDYAYKDRVETDGRIVPEWITDSFTRITGYSLEETQSPDFWQRLVHPDHLQLLLEHIKIILSGQPDTKEFRIITKTGQVRWLRDYANPVWDANQNRVASLYGAVQDVTERKQVEEGLRQSEERFASAFRSSPTPIALTRLSDGKIMDVNEAFCQLFGYSHEEIVGRTSLEVGIADPESRQKALEMLKEKGAIRNLEQTARNRDGLQLDILNSVENINVNGEPYALTTLIDITERKKAEEYLRRFELLSEHSRDIILFMGREDGRILEANAAAVRAYGYSREELLSLTIRDLRARDTLGLTAEQMAQADARGILFETNHRRKDGSIFPVEVSSQGAKIGGARTLISIIRDITERKYAEEALRLKDQLLHLTSEMAKVGGWEFDPQTGKGTWTDEVARIHDVDPTQATNVEIGLSVYVGESREKIEQAVKEAIEFGKPYDLELELISIKGDRKWVRTMALPIVQNDKVVKVQGIFQDITERKQIEKALQAAHDELELKVQERTAALSEANALLKALMDNMPDHIYFKDLQSCFIRTSRSQANLLGLSEPVEVIGKSDFDFFPHAARAYDEEQEVMRSGTPLIDLEEWVVWPDGRETWVSTTKMPLRNADGQTIGIFGISHDITERKRTEQEIKQLNADLEKQAEKLWAANKELEAFSYSVSHDLRAPLRAIDGYTRILVEDYESVLDAEGKRICGIISREARRMGQLIDDLLAFSRLGRKEMYTSRVDMRGMAVSVLNELLKEEERARLDFQIGKLPAVKADSSLIRQVWFNLLANAIKFTSKKERAVIEIGSKTTKEELIYFVRDTGAGFDMEYANKLFGVFQRLHSESEFDGTGVGLAIIQRIIHRHEGRVWAEGEVEKGATFYFALPRKEDHHE
jgi:PAS domain S-box-containing protein